MGVTRTLANMVIKVFGIFMDLLVSKIQGGPEVRANLLMFRFQATYGWENFA